MLACYRRLRVNKSITRILGPQFVRSRNRIEIDLTYKCNLRCTSCNRSVSQAPENLRMSRAMIQDFIHESMLRGKQWRKIRLLGGEPTLHPEFLPILNDLLQYKNRHPDCIIEVVTNGYGKAVNAMLQMIPAGVVVENSAKESSLQASFSPFNLAPVDDNTFRNADYRNGCEVMKACGMALTPLGYYPCAVAGGIDRVEGNRLGRAHLPRDEDDMTSMAERLCRLCGHFKEGYLIPEHIRPAGLQEQISPTWKSLYARWRGKGKASTRRGAAKLTDYQLRFTTSHTNHSQGNEQPAVNREKVKA